jgi:eukaryotic-like serine/threonine-protein kinase
MDVLFCPRDGTPLGSSRTPSLSERDPYVGLELAGQIRIKHLVGVGSMGRVYRAFQGGIDRDVAVKILHRELSGNAELVGRFHREAKVASRLVHPNVVQVLMTGSLPVAPDARVGGELYLVMEYLDGISLLSALGAAGEDCALPLTRALHIALQACDAVGEAHAQGIVHRDLKPENVMLVRRGEDADYVKVLDFGIARVDWVHSEMATQAGLIFGTAKYISPEGAEGQPVGPAADVYSLATIVYQMLSGRTPFDGESPVALLVQHTHAPPPDLRSVPRASYVPAPLAAVIMANLAKRPGERAANARVFGRDLVAAARQSGLYPEEIATQSTLFSPGKLGAVKLASRERTKALELSPDVAARIEGLRGAGSDPSLPKQSPAEGPPAHLASSPESNALHAATETAAPTSGPSFTPNCAPSSAPASFARAQVSDASHAAPPPARPPFDTEDDLDFGDQASAPHGNASQPTIQGTETTLTEEHRPPLPRRARLARVVALVTCALVATPLVILGGRRLGGETASGSAALETTLDEARAAMQRHAWDAPPGNNLKEITDAALARSPGNERVLALRREAAERIVSDALGRKYAGDVSEALRLARLALAWSPELASAQRLAAELEAGRAADIAPASPPSSRPSATPEDHPSGKSLHGRGRDTRAADVKASETKPGEAKPGEAKPVDPKAPPGVKPASENSGAVLPPPPPPLPVDHAPSPAPGPTGPWL